MKEYIGFGLWICLYIDSSSVVDTLPSRRAAQVCDLAGVSEHMLRGCGTLQSATVAHRVPRQALYLGA